MSDLAYQRMIELIQDNQQVARFADFGQGIKLDSVTRAEEQVGIPFPETYRWWLLNYGGGDIAGEEIFSIYESHGAIGGDLVFMYRLALSEGGNPKHIPLCHSDTDGLFWFEVQEGLQGNEYTIVSQATGKTYAATFLDFLTKRIALFA